MSATAALTTAQHSHPDRLDCRRRRSGKLATLALIHRPDTTVIAAGAAIVTLAAHLAGSVGNTLPGIITAISNLLTSRIRAKADAESTNTSATTRSQIALAGLDPGKTAVAAEMLRAMSGNPDLPKERRPQTKR